MNDSKIILVDYVAATFLTMVIWMLHMHSIRLSRLNLPRHFLVPEFQSIEDITLCHNLFFCLIIFNPNTLFC